MNRDAFRTYLATTFGHRPHDLELFERAVTHSSASRDTYERLEFLGDRVLGLVIAHWLYQRFGDEPEGKLSRRYNVLVARDTCGEIGREIGLHEWIRLGRQAREDGASFSDNVVGDVVEAVIGALYLEGGLTSAESFVRKAWAERVDTQAVAPKHPKSALQEYAAAKGLASPIYSVVQRSGAHHLPRFTLRVSIDGAGEATAEGSSKQEAETAAAAALLEQLK